MANPISRPRSRLLHWAVLPSWHPRNTCNEPMHVWRDSLVVHTLVTTATLPSCSNHFAGEKVMRRSLSLVIAGIALLAAACSSPDRIPVAPSSAGDASVRDAATTYLVTFRKDV